MERGILAFIRDEDGQTMVEFALMIMIAVTLVSVMNRIFRSAIKKMWIGLSKEIAAACPSGCAAPPEIR